MKRIVSLAGVALLAGLGIAGTLQVQQTTAPYSAAQRQALDSRVRLSVLPAGSYDNQPLEHPLPLHDVQLANSRLSKGWLATLDGQPRAVLFQSRTQGYEGPIDLLIAIGSDARLLGVKTLTQRETPGLGSPIADEDHPWIRAFQGKSRNDPTDPGWALKKDQGAFDQLAGATVTSRAVLQATHDALRYFDEQRRELLKEPGNE